jgi:hypothetical protein
MYLFAEAGLLLIGEAFGACVMNTLKPIIYLANPYNTKVSFISFKGI